MGPGGTVFLLLLAPWVGSFLALLADRLPRGEDVVFKPSACRNCGHRLMPRDLLPVLSWLAQRGRCRRCDARVPGWLPAMEIAALALAVAALWRGGSALEIWITTGVLWVLLCLFACDMLWMRLPNVLNALLLLLCLWGAWLSDALQPALLGGLIGAASFWALRVVYQLLRRREGLGLGDVKMMAGLGALTGPEMLPLLVLIAAGGALALLLLIGRTTRADTALPLGSALSAASMCLLLGGWGLI